MLHRIVSLHHSPLSVPVPLRSVTQLDVYQNFDINHVVIVDVHVVLQPTGVVILHACKLVH